jgi:hypothetical protein
MKKFKQEYDLVPWYNRRSTSKPIWNQAGQQVPQQSEAGKAAERAWEQITPNR